MFVYRLWAKQSKDEALTGIALLFFGLRILYGNIIVLPVSQRFLF
jgi:hypothetical protein